MSVLGMKKSIRRKTERDMTSDSPKGGGDSRQREKETII
jgi:hypothetical protein